MGEKRGFFLTLEGTEGAGKTTLAQSLRAEFAENGTQVVVTCEPGGDEVGQAIRSLLLGREFDVVDRAELMLFEAARAQNVRNVIMPALDAGCLVICDRFADSSIAYQGYGRGLDRRFIDSANQYAAFGLVPDLTLLLDIPVEEGLARQLGADRIGSVELAFHQRVREGFVEIARKNPDRIVVLDASLPADSVAKRAFDLVSERMASIDR
jgi:dTMP kinase